ncbi:MAG: H4MPT-linked C1 transfer pathway protein [Planctomycetes bacterium]|nr:H4MPT-linked C1 transfer pathway protein [Planctomycetota bacterium]
MHWIGLDVGGANLKAADCDGIALTRSFPVWKEPERLTTVLGEILSAFPQCDAVAVTMTAELADCFETKADGVDAVLQSVEQAAANKPIFVWQTGAEFVTPQVAREIPRMVAAANWHALATWVGRMVPTGSSVLFDVGSTTTDLIPLLRGVPVPSGLTDLERLLSGELVYSGVRRTPLCSLARRIPLRESDCPLASEFFATTLDLYLTLRMIPPDPDDLETANGKPATIAAAFDRLARMVCCDRTEFTAEDAQSMAHFLADIQQRQIAGALQRVLQKLEPDCSHVLISGSGSFLAEKIVRSESRLQSAKITRLQDLIGNRTSDAACAFAVALLASERLTV